MQRYLACALMLTCFAATMGYFSHRVAHPLAKSEYQIGGDVTVFHWPGRPRDDSPRKALYLRGTFPLAAPPEYAWIKIVAQDTMRVWVNGEQLPLAHYTHPRSHAGNALDIARYLKEGTNVVALECRQVSLDQTPAAAITGEICQFGGHIRAMEDARFWKVHDHAERVGHHWYTVEFDDQHWPHPAVESRHLTAQVDLPPTAVSTVPGGGWISPPAGGVGEGILARKFTITTAPQRGWLRYLATGPTRVAVNGVEVANDNEDLAGRIHRANERTILNIAPLLRTGENQIVVRISTPGEEPHLRADFAISTRGGDEQYYETDASWQGTRFVTADWQSMASQDDWSAARVAHGGMGLRASQVGSRFLETETPLSYRINRWLSVGAYMLACGLAASLGVLATLWLIRGTESAKPFSTAPVYALLLPTCAAAAGIYTTYDPAFGEEAVFQPIWLAALWGVLLLQWAALVWMSRSATSLTVTTVSDRRLHYAVAGYLVILTMIATWLRFENIVSEPIHHDEVTCYDMTIGTLQYGFPGGKLSEDTPFGWSATSELNYICNAPFALLFDDPLLILRVPAALWAIATLWLMFYVGWKLFGPEVAVVAALLYTFSPYLVGMANFGRYFSQLQFFVLLTTYLFYRTIEGRGPINRRALWGTALSFSALYLTWEGAGLIAPGMVLAAWFHRRGRMQTIICSPSIYAAIVVAGAVYVAQDAHRIMQQTQRLWIGTGISDLEIMPMWRYQVFDPDFYFLELSWIKEGLLPLLTLGLAIVAAYRSRFQYPLRVFLIVVIGNCVAMTALLPLRSGRYTYHLIALSILCCAVGVVALVEAARGLLGNREWLESHRVYWRSTSAAVLAMFVLLSCGHLVLPVNLREYQTTAFSPNRLKFNDWDGPVDYLRRHYRAGDVVVATLPHAVNHTMTHSRQGPIVPDWKTDYWLQTNLVLQATMSDDRDTLLDRRSGVEMIYSTEGLAQLFTSPRRIWYLTTQANHRFSNIDEVSTFMRQNMDVVYEDYQTVVLVRDQGVNRTASARLDDEDAADRARSYYLD